MTEDSHELIETPETCVETTEYDNRIDEEFEIEPEVEDVGVYEPPGHWEEIELKFARFERNYRVRRIRELTLRPLAPVKNKRGPIRNRMVRKTTV